MILEGFGSGLCRSVHRGLSKLGTAQRTLGTNCYSCHEKVPICCPHPPGKETSKEYTCQHSTSAKDRQPCSLVTGQTGVSAAFQSGALYRGKRRCRCRCPGMDPVLGDCKGSVLLAAYLTLAQKSALWAPCVEAKYSSATAVYY